MAACTHLEAIELTQLPPAVDGCDECLAAGGVWCHLRICLTCGHVGCCDSSPATHATRHAQESGHALVRSIEPGEQWSWCYADEVLLRVPSVTGQTRIPPSPLGG